ncbi:AlpA family transcriptional regulator [Arthrobacter sp. ISL-28]|uniref:helix-turn-helix transcriptional regulator n=1 Tax=Arthrobacter sp. ISL-28 TaxID=2819108 RepID=UPI001BE81D0D|nr:AlpA family phage regulatory protein [Arthrobacter sp. ISL-28]MBT2523244.1 AlpA family phage regulatory protein [Arthrobacter sp. ISL-28]
MGQAKGTVMALISPSVVEQNYGIPVAQLRRWRTAGIGPEYFRLGPRSIGYYAPDVDDWLEDPANAHLHDVPSHEHAFRRDRKVLITG